MSWLSNPVKIQKSGRRRAGVISMRLGVPELVVILMIVVLIFGASRLPELGRGIGKGIKNFKDATKDGSKPEQS
jgi:sec-independent protein translocase protein TatA